MGLNTETSLDAISTQNLESITKNWLEITNPKIRRRLIRSFINKARSGQRLDVTIHPREITEDPIKRYKILSNSYFKAGRGSCYLNYGLDIISTKNDKQIHTSIKRSVDNLREIKSELFMKPEFAKHNTPREKNYSWKLTYANPRFSEQTRVLFEVLTQRAVAHSYRVKDEELKKYLVGGQVLVMLGEVYNISKGLETKIPTNSTLIHIESGNQFDIEDIVNPRIEGVIDKYIKDSERITWEVAKEVLRTEVSEYTGLKKIITVPDGSRRGSNFTIVNQNQV